MAVLNPKVSHVMVDGGMFQDEVNEKKIMAVPTIYLNGEHFSQGPHEPGRDRGQARQQVGRA